MIRSGALSTLRSIQADHNGHDVGKLPGFILDQFDAEDLHADITDVHLEHNYTLTLREGEAPWDAIASVVAAARRAQHL